MSKSNTLFSHYQSAQDHHRHQSITEVNSLPYIDRRLIRSQISRVVAKSQRNHVLIIGPAGVGKTSLIKNSLRSLSQFHSLSLRPSQADFESTLTKFSNQIEKPLLLLLDELFAFKIPDIQIAIEYGVVLATASETAYRRAQADYGHILAKFEIITLTEPNHEEMMSILSAWSDYFASYHQISISQDILDAVLAISKKHLHDLSLPAKAIALIEEASIAACELNHPRLEIELIQSIVSQKTGIPLTTLTAAEIDRLNDLEVRLKQTVKGQSQAIKVIVEAIRRSRLGLRKDHKPVGSFLLVGPSGVGKTETAKALAHEVYGDVDAMIRLDMSEYTLEHTVQRLIGAPPGYIGFEAGGQLTNPVRQKPYSLVLLDEIEKANPRVFDTFLQVLDDGRLTDGQGKTVDFSQTLILATSNAGLDDILDLLQENKSPQVIEAEVKEILADYFRIEFLNRFDAIVVYQALDVLALIDIAQNQIEILTRELAHRHINLQVSWQTISNLATQAVDPRYGARELIRLIQQQIESPLASMILEGRLTPGEKVEF